MSEPIIGGFHPDPSICRVGGDYYLINSSFEYFPGVPIFHSRDLVSWEQIGHVLSRASQLNVRPGIAGSSKGIYAPSIRHHDGRFWVTTTNIDDIARGHLIVHAEQPEGPWSDPVFVEGTLGVDPDLVWDDTGTCRITWSDPVGHGIAQAAVDPLSGALMSSPKTIWMGTGLAHPEGPHLFRRGGWWYLVVAEGGTHTGHAVSVARSRNVDGPFEVHPANPILSHRSTTHPVQSTGHADLVELADGSWAMVHLGTRPGGSFPKFHVNGRETFLAGVDWVDGWPVVVEDRFDIPPADTSFTDIFAPGELHDRWVSPGVDPATFARGGADGLSLSAGRSAAESESTALLATRAQDGEWMASVEVARGDVALVVRMDDAHWFGIERVGRTVRARAVIGPLDQILGERAGIDVTARLAVRSVAHQGRSFRSGPDRLSVGVLVDGVWEEIAGIDGRYVSTEVAGGFTGRVIGVEALGAPAVVSDFRYRVPQ